MSADKSGFRKCHRCHLRERKLTEKLIDTSAVKCRKIKAYAMIQVSENWRQNWQKCKSRAMRPHKCSSQPHFPAFFAPKHEKSPAKCKAYGADNQIWTGDLILTKDALYQLSYISIRVPASESHWQHWYNSTLFRKMQEGKWNFFSGNLWKISFAGKSAFSEEKMRSSLDKVSVCAYHYIC